MTRHLSVVYEVPPAGSEPRPAGSPPEVGFIAATLTIHIAWPDGEGPRSTPAYGVRVAEWSQASVVAALPLARSTIRLRMSGAYVKNDGTVGRQAASQVGVNLVDLDEGTQVDVMQLLDEAAAVYTSTPGGSL